MRLENFIPVASELAPGQAITGTEIDTLGRLAALAETTSDAEKSYIVGEAAKELRNAWLDNLLDPDRMLPKISVCEDPKALQSGLPEPGMTGYEVYGADNKPIGLFRLATQPDPDIPGNNIEHLTWIQTDKPGQGYGKAMYLAILKQLPDSSVLDSGKNLRQGSFNMWQWLASQHVAVQNEGKIIFDEDEERGYIWNEHGTPLFKSVVPDSRFLWRAQQTSHPR